MFVLPPPPRYPGVNGPGSMGSIMPPIETNNLLTNPTGPEWQFLVGEGTYVLKEDLHLATPPPHPSETIPLNPNPLATTPQPATAGTKVTLLNTAIINNATHSNRGSTTANGQDYLGGEGRHSEGGISSDGRTSMTSDALGGGPLGGSNYAPDFGHGNALLSQPSLKDPNKRKKPKNNMAKSNSSFISRVILNDTLTKKLVDRPNEGMFAFANINRAFQWLDLSSPVKQDYLTKILFTKATCLCHDVNTKTNSAAHIDVIMGFSTGEIIWWEPISQRYTRLNKNGIINTTAVSEIKWIPGSENLFLAAHMDGTLVVYDKEKDDALFSTEEEEPPMTSGSTGTGNSIPRSVNQNKNAIQIHKSVHSKNQKVNPVAVWKLSNQRIKAFAFSPDNRHLAVVSEDGTLRIMDYLQEELLEMFYSYYGGLSCVCWSPDAKYVLTGGQDDLISIWSFEDSVLVARCQGHHSWVSAVVFDPWRCDDRNYRFGSVGEDGRLCLWDFNVGMLHRPRAHSIRHRASMSSRSLATIQRERAETISSRLRSNSNVADSLEDGVSHPVEPRAKIPILPAILNKTIDTHPACWLQFTEDSIMTSCNSGHIRTWNRPGVDVPSDKKPAEI